MIDWHSHILPGIDDGPEIIEQSVDMASALSSAGIATVYCTPHLMRGCYEAGNVAVRKGVLDLQERLDSLAISLVLKPGREYCLDEYLLSALDDPLPLGDSNLILVEILPSITEDMVRNILYSVVRRGFTPVLAHPERCRLFRLPNRHRRKGLLGSLKELLTFSPDHPVEQDEAESCGNTVLDYLREIGCRFQGNLGSFAGFYGREVRDLAISMNELGLYDRYGSDLHSPEHADAVFKGLDLMQFSTLPDVVLN